MFLKLEMLNEVYTGQMNAVLNFLYDILAEK